MVTTKKPTRASLSLHCRNQLELSPSALSPLALGQNPPVGPHSVLSSSAASSVCSVQELEPAISGLHVAPGTHKPAPGSSRGPQTAILTPGVGSCTFSQSYIRLTAVRCAQSNFLSLPPWEALILWQAGCRTPLLTHTLPFSFLSPLLFPLLFLLSLSSLPFSLFPLPVPSLSTFPFPAFSLLCLSYFLTLFSFSVRCSGLSLLPLLQSHS